MAAGMAVAMAIMALLGQGAVAQSPRPTYEDWQMEKSAQQADALEHRSNQSKMAAVDKVTQLMENLKMQVLAEGEAEAKTYDKFACFCKTTQKDKTDAISEGQDNKQTLSGNIEALAAARDKLDTKIAGLVSEIAAAEKEIETATQVSNEALGVYEKNEADLSGAIYGLEQAIKALKASKGPTLVQLQSVSKTVTQAALMADALGLTDEATEKALALFQQAPEVPMENYKFHSDGIIKTLEKLLKDFRDKKVDVDKEEVARVAAYNSFVQEKTDFIKAKNKELDGARKEKEEKIEAIATNSAELSTVSAVLLDDQEYLLELNKICSEKAHTWDQRTQARAAELQTLTQVIEILKTAVAEHTYSATIRFAQARSTVHFADAVANSESAMNAIEAEAEEADDSAASYPTSFLQRRAEDPKGSLLSVAHRHVQSAVAGKKAPVDAGRQAVINLLSSKGVELKSTLLTALATRISDDPFAKVKKLIQELIERLLAEAANEANQKGWCDKAQSDAAQQRDFAAEEIATLNAKMAKLEAEIEKLDEQHQILEQDIRNLKTARALAVQARREESAENAKIVQEAKDGLDAIAQAIQILDRFYKTSAKGKVVYSPALAQQTPGEDAPDAGFESGEAYLGAQAEAGGIIGMMEVIQSDFERTIKETEQAEAEAQQAHLGYMTVTGQSLAEKTVAEQETSKYLSEAKSKHEAASDEMDSQTSLLQSAIQQLLELKPACVDTGMSYSDRVARREEEIAALKKALCILGAYQTYGPDGLADAC